MLGVGSERQKFNIICITRRGFGWSFVDRHSFCWQNNTRSVHFDHAFVLTLSSSFMNRLWEGARRRLCLDIERLYCQNVEEHEIKSNRLDCSTCYLSTTLHVKLWLSILIESSPKLLAGFLSIVANSVSLARLIEC